MTDFEASSAGRCRDSRDRVPWAVETEVCKRMFSLKVSSSCDVATEATFHSFGLIAFASLWSFSRWWHHVSVSSLMPAQWKFPDLAKCQKDMAAVAVAPMTSSKRNCCRNSNYILKIKGVRENLCIFPTLPERFGTYYYLHIAETFLPAILTACLILLRWKLRGNPVGGQIFHNIISQHFQLQLMKLNDSLAPSPKRQLYKTCLHLTPPPAIRYAVVTISDVAWLAGKKEKTRPEISGAEKYDLRALESSLMAVARGILVGKGGDDVGAGGPPRRKIGAEVAGVCF